jgi:fatty acid-binding protein DegV
MAVLHADGEKLAKSLLDDLQDLISVGRVILSPAGAAVTAHLGVGAVGVCALTALESE